MDHWHPHFVRAETPDPIAEWANLEGKTPAMSHDLLLRYAAITKPKQVSAIRIGMIGELFVAALDAWYQIRSR